MRNKAFLIVSGLTIVGFLLRFYLLVVTDSHTTDGIAFLATAEYFRNPSEWVEAPSRLKMPFFPLLAYLGSFLTSGDVISAGLWVNTILGVLMIPVVFVVARYLFNEWVGYLAALLIAIDIEFIKYSVLDRSDLQFTLIILLVIYYFWKIPWEKCDYRHGLFFGMLLGLAQLTRSNAVFFLAVCLIYWIVYAVRNNINVRRFIPCSMLPVFIVFIILSSLPSLYMRIINVQQPSYLGHAFIEGTLIAKGEREHEWFQLNDDSTEFVKDQIIREFQISNYLNWETACAKYNYGWNFIFGNFFDDMWNYLHGWLCLLGTMSIILIAKSRDLKGWDKVGYLASYIAPFLLILPAIQVQSSYLLPLRLILIIIFAWIIIQFVGIKQLGKLRYLFAGIILFAAFAINLQNCYVHRDRVAGRENGYRLVGKYLRTIKEPGDKVMAKNNSIYLYSMMRGYTLPAELLDKTLAFCFNNGVKYFVYGPDERYVRSAWSHEIKDMINDGDTRFELIHIEIKGGPIVVYKLNDTGTVSDGESSTEQASTGI